MELSSFNWKKLSFVNEFKNDICGFSLTINQSNGMAYAYGGYGNRTWYSTLKKFRVEVCNWTPQKNQLFTVEKRSRVFTFFMIYSLLKKKNFLLGTLPR